jgi:hypothetical protein
VGIALLIGVRVVLAMHRHPANRIALERKRSENRQQIFQRFEKAQTTVR